MLASASRARSGSLSNRCRPTPDCTAIWLSEWASTSCSSRAMRVRSSCSAVRRRSCSCSRRSVPRSRRRRTPSPIAKHSASPTVVSATRNGWMRVSSSPMATIAISHAAPTETSAQMRARRTTAPMIANARAMNGGETSGGTNRSASVSAATAATVGPGQRRAASRARADAAASAVLSAAYRNGTCCHTEMPIVPGTWMRSESTTGTRRVTAGGGRKRGPNSSQRSPGMRSIVRRGVWAFRLPAGALSRTPPGVRGASLSGRRRRRARR